MLSREAMEATKDTMQYYRVKLGKFLPEVNPDIAQRQDIEAFLLQFKNPGNRHAYYRAIKTFFNWREETFGFTSPMIHMKAPKIPKVILPVLTKEEVQYLIDYTNNIRNKAIISFFVESGQRLTAAADIKPEDINWEHRIIKVRAKGQKEAFATFGDMTAGYLKEWLAQYQPDSNIWGIDKWGIISMLRRLEKATGIKCNAHVFRRTFACLLRMDGVPTLAIKDLGGWETSIMVEHYTRAMGFHDSLKFYKGPLSDNSETT